MKKRPFILSFFFLSILVFIFKWLTSIFLNYPWGEWKINFNATILLFILGLGLTFILFKQFEKRAIFTAVIFCIASFFALDIIMEVARQGLIEPEDGWHDDYNSEGLAVLLKGTTYYLIWGVYFDLVRFIIKKYKKQY